MMIIERAILETFRGTMSDDIATTKVIILEMEKYLSKIKRLKSV